MRVPLEHHAQCLDDSGIRAAGDRRRPDRSAVHNAEQPVGLIGSASALQQPKVGVASLFRQPALYGQFVNLGLLALAQRRGRDVELRPGESASRCGARDAVDDLGEVFLPPPSTFLDLWRKFVEEGRRRQGAA